DMAVVDDDLRTVGEYGIGLQLADVPDNPAEKFARMLQLAVNAVEEEAVDHTQRPGRLPLLLAAELNQPHGVHVRIRGALAAVRADKIVELPVIARPERSRTAGAEVRIIRLR